MGRMVQVCSENMTSTTGTASTTDTSLRFAKMHGLGNDFVLVDAAELSAVILSEKRSFFGQNKKDSLEHYFSTLAAQVCDRNFGIGADGLIVAIDLKDLQKKVENLGDNSQQNFYLALEKFTADYPERDNCDVAWVYVNSDGSYSAMCGNGLRCLTLFVRDLGWSCGESFNVSTSVYPVAVSINKRTVPGGEGYNTVEVVTRLAGPKYSQPAGETTIEVSGKKMRGINVSMGNPHFVIFDDGADGTTGAPSLDQYVKDIKAAQQNGGALKNFSEELLKLAGDIQKLSVFPEGVNVEFVKIEASEPDTAYVFVMERGCGATLACASGAAAVLAAGVISKRLNKKSYVILPGGKLEVSLSSVEDQGCMEAEKEYIYLTGPATRVFCGDVSLRGINL